MFCIIFVFNFRWENTINLLINYILTPAHQLKHTLRRATSPLHGTPRESSSEPSARAASSRAAGFAGDFNQNSWKTKEDENEQPGNLIFGYGSSRSPNLVPCAAPGPGGGCPRAETAAEVTLTGD